MGTIVGVDNIICVGVTGIGVGGTGGGGASVGSNAVRLQDVSSKARSAIR